MPERYVKVVDVKDNVGTFLRDVDAGETIEIPINDEVVTVTTNDDIVFGHKVAIEDIAEGETVYKYGKSIGNATEDIPQGDWVHVHNVESNYGRGDKAEAESVAGVSE